MQRTLLATTLSLLLTGCFDSDDGLNESTPTIVNLPPKLSTSLEHEVSADSTGFKTVLLTAIDPENDTLTYALVKAPEWVELKKYENGTTGLSVDLSKVEMTVGKIYEIVFSVSDGVNTVNHTMILVVEPKLNTPPVVNAISTITLSAGSSASREVFFYDAEDDVVTFSLVGEPTWVSINAQTGVLMLTPSEAVTLDTYLFEVVVDDGVNEVSQDITVVITAPEVAPPPPNYAPELALIPNQVVRVNEVGTYRVSATDINSTDTLTYTVLGAPRWVVIDSSGLLEFAPTSGAESQTYDFTVTVSDGQLDVSRPVSLSVLGEAAPDPVLYTVSIAASGARIVGAVDCNGSPIDANTGVFEAYDSEGTVTCFLGETELGTWSMPTTRSRMAATELTFDLNALHGSNAAKVMASIDKDNDPLTFTLDYMNGLDIADVFTKLSDNNAVDAFVLERSEKATDEIGAAPSSHVDNSIVAEENPEASADLDSGFISATAEQASAYKPSKASQVLTQAVLRDADGKKLAGVSYYSKNAKGVTASDGIIEYVWGDSLTLGIDTFEFGSVKGNKLDYNLSDVTEDLTTQRNIQSLVERYTVINGDSRVFGEVVHKTFAKYPNTINTLINLALPNGGELVDTEGKPTGFFTPNEFLLQFEEGLTATLDKEIKAFVPSSYSYSHKPRMTYSANGTNLVEEALKEVLEGVTDWHVIHDNGSWYGNTGFARGMRALNLTNEGFPIVMPRNDANRKLSIGEKQAWADHIHPHVLKHNGELLNPIPEVSGENVTYGLPFVSAGGIGTGKVVFMGNLYYSNMLSCPTNYWAIGWNELNIDSANKTCRYKNDPALDLQDKRYDKGSMQNFFTNLLGWMSPEHKAGQAITVGTNIGTAYFANQKNGYYGDPREDNLGIKYDFFIHGSYNVGSTNYLTSGSYGSLDPQSTPILLLQGFDHKPMNDGSTLFAISDTANPRLTVDDVTDLIHYVNKGGNIVFFDSLVESNPEPIGRLADAVGLAVGGSNVTPTEQTFCGTDTYCQVEVGRIDLNPHVRHKEDLVVLEILPKASDASGDSYTVNPDKTISWNPNYFVPLTVASWETDGVVKRSEEECNGKDKLPDTSDDLACYDCAYDANKKKVMCSLDSKGTDYAYYPVTTPEDKQTAINNIKAQFPDVEVCTDDEYEWEFGCIEFRKGHGNKIGNNYGRPYFTRYSVTAGSLAKAANIGEALERLFWHEVYYRTGGKKDSNGKPIPPKGERLSSADLEQTYGNLTAWLWNDNQYEYVPDAAMEDGVGFELLTNFLNCYTNDKHDGGNSCSDDLGRMLLEYGMVNSKGELEPSYPLNFKEKPLTRMMLGRSFWDYDITVNTEEYPTRPLSNTSSTETVTVTTDGQAVHGTAGNMQSTGLWANQLETITVSGSGSATITVMLADDLTGRAQHEVAMKRPPRMQQSFKHFGGSTSFKVPYGGLIYVQPNKTDVGDLELTISGVTKAPLYKFDPVTDKGSWVNGVDSGAQLAEIDTGHYIYTTHVNNVSNMDVAQFSRDMNRFADAASDFHGRDSSEAGDVNERFTHENLTNFRHRVVNDRQISIGAGHSGYPVMIAMFNAEKDAPPTDALNDWLLWHETGHNLAAAPFNVEGATEVNNNILALYMQENNEDGRNPVAAMARVRLDIQKAPMWLSRNNGHAWTNGNAGIRLVMFAQLKLWAQDYFNIDEWYAANRPDEEVPEIFGEDQGWNLIKLMHRLAREENQYCVGENKADVLGVCASYASGYNLSSFFKVWNAGETKFTTPEGEDVYMDGVTNEMVFTINGLSLPKPELLPENINRL